MMCNILRRWSSRLTGSIAVLLFILLMDRTSTVDSLNVSVIEEEGGELMVIGTNSTGGDDRNKSVTFILASPTILSGDLEECQNATDETCNGGAATLMAFARYYSEESDLGRLVIPKLDYQSPFVQMHPLSWSVNRFVYNFHYNLDTFWALQSLLTQHRADSAVGNRDLSDLQTHEFEPLLSNIAVPSSNSWSQYIKNIHFHNETGLAVIMAMEKVTGYGISLRETALALVRYIYEINRRSGCIESSPTPYIAYAFLNNVTIAPETCWIPVLVTVSHIIDDFDSFLDEMTASTYAPAVIIDQEGSREEFQNPFKMRNTWLISKFYDDTDIFIQLRLFLSQDRKQVLNVTVTEDDLGTIPEDVKDEQFTNDISFMRKLADEAYTNDPVVGTSGFMPFTRDGHWRKCMGGECPIGNLFTDAIRWKAQADIAFINSGGVRGPGWPAGPVRISDIWRSLPFANQICDATMTGLSIFRLFEYSTSRAEYLSTFTDEGDRLLQVSGARITYNTQLNASRLISIDMWDDEADEYKPLERLKLYKVASGSWECFGFDPVPSYLSDQLVIPGEEPAVVYDDLLQNIIAEYLTDLNATYDTSIQSRLVNNTDATKPMDWIQTEDSCTSREYWVEEQLTCFDCPNMGNVKFLEKIMEAQGVSGEDMSVSFEATVVNGQNFTVSLLPKAMPSWISRYLEGGDASNQITLEPGEAHVLFFSMSASDVTAGTAQATVSFALQDKDTYLGCSGDDVSFQAVLIVNPPPELNKPEEIRYAGFLLMAVICATAIGFAVWVYLYRHYRVVKSRQPEFLVTLCAGFMILALSILPLSIVDELDSSSGRNRACMSTAWLVFIGFDMVMLALYAKLWRLNKLFNNASLSRMRITAKDAYFACGILFACTVLLLFLWTLIDPLKWAIRHVPGEDWNRYGSCSDVGTAGLTLFCLVLVISLLSILLTAYQAFQARNISDEFSESKELGIAVYASFQIVLVGMPIMFMISDDNPDARYLLQIMIIFGICMSGLLVIFVPMMREHYMPTGPTSRVSSSRQNTRISAGTVRVTGVTLPIDTTQEELADSVHERLSNLGGSSAHGERSRDLDGSSAHHTRSRSYG